MQASKASAEAAPGSTQGTSKELKLNGVEASSWNH
ncbi:hypothetical protein RDI58_030089 [Solanum bulbocastanum]|uniref:Uncharacterized protein n=1 Tax=Solanum bulbocastanum TaxID=147425 RepID=A0AAN8Y0K7_SOLBU